MRSVNCAKCENSIIYKPYRYRFWPKKHFPVGSSSTLELVAANGFASSKAHPVCSLGHLATDFERIHEQDSSFRSAACGFLEANNRLWVDHLARPIGWRVFAATLAKVLRCE